MKSTIFTKFTWILALSAVIFTSLFYMACTKDVNVASEQSQSAIEAAAAKDAAFALSPKEQAESLAKTSYNHLKFYYTQKKADDYVNPLIRKTVMDALAKVEADYKGLTFEESIQKALSDKMISPQMAQSFRNLNTVAVAASNDVNLNELETRFKVFEEKVYADKTLKDEEKMQIGATSASLRSVMRYKDELDKATISNDATRGNATLRGNCIFGRRLECFAGMFFKASLAAVVTGVITGGTGTAVGFLAGLVVGIINIYVDNSCVCDNPTSGGGCFNIQFLNPIISSGSPCNPAVGFVVSGPGTLPTVFNWTATWIDAQGFERTIQDVNFKPTLGPALAPFIVPDPNTVITLTVVPFGCPPKQFSFSLKSLLGDPGSVLISGPFMNTLTSTSTFTMSGSCLVNPYNQFSWNEPSVGYIVSGGNTPAATIQFTMKTCGSSGFYGGCFPAYIRGRSINPCYDQLDNGDVFSARVN